MSAETLRRAASLMRERAEACLSSDDQWYEVNEMLVMLRSVDSDSNAQPYDAEHIASWHPAVALAVADWLEDAAENLDMQAPGGDLRKNWDMRVHIAGDKALAVARAYLGDS